MERGRYAPICEPDEEGEQSIVGELRRSLNAIRARWARWEREGKGLDRCQCRFVSFAQHEADHARAMREKQEYAARKERRPKLRFMPPIPCPLFDGETPEMYEIALQLWFKSKGEALVGPAENPDVFRSKRCNYAVARLHGRVNRALLERAIRDDGSSTHVLARYITAAKQQAAEPPGSGAPRSARPREAEPLAPKSAGRTQPTSLGSREMGPGPDARGGPRSHSAERCLLEASVRSALAEGKLPDCGHESCAQKWAECAGIALSSLRRSMGKSRERSERAQRHSEAEIAHLRQQLAMMEGRLQVVMSAQPHGLQRPMAASGPSLAASQHGPFAAAQHMAWSTHQAVPTVPQSQGWTPLVDQPRTASSPLGQLVAEDDPPYEGWPSPRDGA